MSGVVLRCPTCGTTQTHPGECDTCSEGEVRYFCSNHTPGRWLDEPVCAGCGAKFGDAPRISPPPSASAPTVPISRVPRRSDSRHVVRPGAEPPRIEPMRPPTSEVDAEDLAATPSLADVLVDMLEEGKRTRARAEDVRWREPVVETPRPPFPVMGCLVRVVLFLLFVFVLFMAGLFTLIGGIIY